MTTPVADYLGFGLGLRAEYYAVIEAQKPPVDWFEIITEDYLTPGGRPIDHLLTIRQDYPMVMHGVSLSIGSMDPLNLAYIQQVKTLAEQLEASWVSDHLCWTSLGGIYTHDLLPLPYNEETLQHVISRVLQVQDIWQRPLVLENPSTYLAFVHSTMTEWQFLQELVKATDCRLLLDINNVYVSAYNHGFDPQTYIEALPIDCVQQFHLAGHLNLGDVIIDTHDHRVIPDVWQLYAFAWQRFGPISTMIERDDRFPPFSALLRELAQARNIAEQTQRAKP